MYVKDMQERQIKFRSEENMNAKAVVSTWTVLSDEQILALATFFGEVSKQEKYATYARKFDEGNLTIGKGNALKEQIREVIADPTNPKFLPKKARKQGEFCEQEKSADSTTVDLDAFLAEFDDMKLSDIIGTDTKVQKEVKPATISDKRLKAIKAELAKAGLSIA